MEEGGQETRILLQVVLQVQELRVSPVESKVKIVPYYLGQSAETISCPLHRAFRFQKCRSDELGTATRRSTSTTRTVADEFTLSKTLRTSLLSKNKVINDSDASSSDFPDISMIGKGKGKGKGKEGKAPSSTTASNDNDESSGYSTPATSAFATPAELPQPKISIVRRDRRTSTMIVEPSTAVGATARALAPMDLRRAQNAIGAMSRKRKRIPDSEEEDEDEEELDAEEDDSPDAQLARALQDQEDAQAADMEDDGDPGPSRRTPRKRQEILPLSDFLSDSDNDQGDEMDYQSPARDSKRPKVELSMSGSNSVAFPTKRKSKVILDSEDSSDFMEIDESDEESDAPIPMPASVSRGKTVKSMQPKSNPKNPARRPDTKVAAKAVPKLNRGNTQASTSTLTSIGSALVESDDSDSSDFDLTSDSESESESDDADPAGLPGPPRARTSRAARQHINRVISANDGDRRAKRERQRLETHHPEILTMWKDLENLPKIGSVSIEQPENINRELKPFQLEGVAWMRAMEKTEWGGGLLGDEMGMGKTIQAVSLIMSDWPAKQPTLVLIPPVALMQWQQEIASYTDGCLKTFVYHGTNAQTKGATLQELLKYNVILMSYNSLESMYRKQEKGFKRKGGLHKEQSLIHQIQFHRVILDEAHNIKQRTTGSAKACFALKADHKWCLSGTPLQNRIGEFFSLVRFLDIKPFACYFCKQCKCSTLNWDMNENNRCSDPNCNHSGMQHVSVFNQELLNPIQKYGNRGPGQDAFRKLRILTDRFMLRRVKRDHSSSMELPAKEIYVDRQFFGEEENDFAGSIMNNGSRKFETYVAQGVLLNNYANIFGLIMQMRQVADHPDLILKRNGDGGQNILVCCICDETAEDAIRSACKHDFCRECARNYLASSGT